MLRRIVNEITDFILLFVLAITFYNKNCYDQFSLFQRSCNPSSQGLYWCDMGIGSSTKVNPCNLRNRFIRLVTTLQNFSSDSKQTKCKRFTNCDISPNGTLKILDTKTPIKSRTGITVVLYSLDHLLNQNQYA